VSHRWRHLPRRIDHVLSRRIDHVPYGELESTDSELVLVCAPAGRDAALTKRLLERANIDAVICKTVEEVCARMSAGAAVALLDERVLDSRTSKCLLEALGEQGEWSDFPIVVFSAASRSRQHDGVESGSLGNVTFLDRPVQVRTMVAAVQVAVRARRRQYQVRRAITLREQFLAMLGHELRNPLASIRLAVESMPREVPLEVAKRQTIIDRQSAHLAHLVDDLLDVARVTNGKVALRRERVDLSEVVRSCFLALRPRAERAGLAAFLTGDSTPRWIDGDRLRLEQIVNNLLGNAIKYTEKGSLTAALRSPDDRVELELTDTGVGMTAATCAGVFDLFAQADVSIDRAAGGMGLGLTVVRGLVDLHGGTVEARSRGPGKGSSFIVSFPSSVSEDSIAKDVCRNTSAPRASNDTKTIVVVDDNNDIREMLSEVLALAGHDVSTAADGREGLESILNRHADAAFVDLGLPIIDGYEVARRARAAGCDALLVAVSGYGQHDDRVRALDAGFDDHMKKPVDLDLLESAIRRGRPTNR
jgi:signal transduction histidine kinase/ActR/RegA family two-component response regulator